MTVTQAHLVRRTFAQLERHGEVAALVFYRRLFELDPELRPGVKGDISEPARKFMDLLGLLISARGISAAPAAEWCDLAAWQAGSDGMEKYLATVRTAMIEMLGLTLGEDFTPEAAHAWEALFSEVEAGAAGEGAREGVMHPV
jgi:hypothetical protein